MSLAERLIELRQQAAKRLGPAVFEIYDSCIDHLREINFIDGCLNVGDKIPEFALPNAEGQLVMSGELLARGLLVICFFRGDWCPYCSLELQALSEVLPRIRATGATLLAVTPDSAGHPLRTKRRFGLEYEVLSDLDNGLGLQFGVIFRVPDNLRRLYESNGIDLVSRHGNPEIFLPIPATYIVDRSGTIRHAELDTDFKRRMEPEAIAQILERLRAEEK